MANTFFGYGAPTNGTSGTRVGDAYGGDTYVDRNTNKTYVNTGTVASPTWVAKSTADGSGNVTTPGTTVYTPSAGQTLLVGTTISPNATFLQINSATAFSSTAVPTITAGTKGQQIFITNTNASNAITLQDTGTLSGSLIKLKSGTTLALAAGLVYEFVFDGTNWVNV